MTGRVGVAISTVPGRTEWAVRAANAWLAAGVVPVIGNVDNDRDGVATTKNRGIAALMDADCEHLLLADDDMYPLQRFSWTRYVDQPIPHLSLSWGRRRLESRADGYSTFAWPRGVLLYVHRSVVEKVGGFRTDYGVAHEHADFSRRVHQSGLTPAPFLDLDQNVRDWFHCEDMARPGETLSQLRSRRRRITTIKRTAADRRRIADLWREHDGDTSFVEYR